MHPASHVRPTSSVGRRTALRTVAESPGQIPRIQISMTSFPDAAPTRVRSRPFLSFLMTSYGTERFVAATIESVLAQTRTDWELIAVDNGGSDEMAGIIGRYLADPRIILIRQENRGIRGGVTAAADAATGHYLCVLNSDDMLLPEYCERIGAMIETDPGIDAVGCDGELFYDPDDGTPPPKSYFASIGRRSVPDPSRAVTLGEFLDEGVPLYIGAFRREVWDTHRGFDPATTDVEPDVALWLSAAAAGDDVRVLPDRLARMRLRPDSASRHPARIDDFQERLLHSFHTVVAQQEHARGGLAESRALRGMRYERTLRTARCSLLAGDVDAARKAAREAYRERHTLRAAAVVAALHISPHALRWVHPVKNTAQRTIERARWRISRVGSP